MSVEHFIVYLMHEYKIRRYNYNYKIFKSALLHVL